MCFLQSCWDDNWFWFVAFCGVCGLSLNQLIFLFGFCFGFLVAFFVVCLGGCVWVFKGFRRESWGCFILNLLVLNFCHGIYLFVYFSLRSDPYYGNLIIQFKVFAHEWWVFPFLILVFKKNGEEKGKLILMFSKILLHATLLLI